MANIRRLFGIVDDATTGGTAFDALAPGVGSGVDLKIIPDATIFWPVTGGTIDRNIERIGRETEVRGRRAMVAPLPFRAAPTVTVPVPAYRSVLEKGLKKVLGGVDTVTPGSGTGPQTHTLSALGFGSTYLPAVHTALVRDDLFNEIAGCVFNRGSFTFPLDAEGTCEFELWGLYHQMSNLSPPTAVYSNVDDVMMLRDAQIFIDPTSIAPPVQSATTTAATGGTLAAGTYRYYVTAFNANGETTVSNEQSQVTTGAASTVTLTWSTVTGATGYRIYRTSGVSGASGSETLLTSVGVVTTYVDTGSLTPGATLPPISNTTATSIPDLTGFEFTWVNNLTRKWYAKRNIAAVSIGTPSLTRKMWFPQENKLGAAQDVTFAINLGNTAVAQELAQDFSQIQKFVFEISGGVMATTPASTEFLRFTIYNAEWTGGGAEPLSARDDITSRFEGSSYYSSADSADVKIEIVNSTVTALT